MDVTLIVALIAAISAIVAPVITALINARNAQKVKTTELYFSAKAEAYQKVLHCFSNASPRSSLEEQQELLDSVSCAQLFSCAETQEKLAILGWYAVDENISEERITAQSVPLKNAILAMQSDLKRNSV